MGRSSLLLIGGFVLIASCFGGGESLTDQKTRAEIEKLKSDARAQELTITKLNIEVDAKKAEILKIQQETKKLESENSNFQIGEYIKWFFGALGLALPFCIAAWQSNKEARVQAQLKAIETAMASKSSQGVKNRLKVLKRAMPKLLKDIPEEIELEGLGFASYKERFLKLIELISENPESKLLAVEAYKALLTEGNKIDQKLESLANKYRTEAPDKALTANLGDARKHYRGTNSR